MGKLGPSVSRINGSATHLHSTPGRSCSVTISFANWRRRNQGRVRNWHTPNDRSVRSAGSMGFARFSHHSAHFQGVPLDILGTRASLAFRRQSIRPLAVLALPRRATSRSMSNRADRITASWPTPCPFTRGELCLWMPGTDGYRLPRGEVDAGAYGNRAKHPKEATCA